MKIKEGFLLRKLGQEYTAVALGSARKEFNGLIRRMMQGGSCGNACRETVRRKS